MDSSVVHGGGGGFMGGCAGFNGDWLASVIVGIASTNSFVSTGSGYPRFC